MSGSDDFSMVGSLHIKSREEVVDDKVISLQKRVSSVRTGIYLEHVLRAKMPTLRDRRRGVVHHPQETHIEVRMDK